jgi:acetylornithine deacetylase
MSVDVVQLTRELLDIESITGQERAVGEYLYAQLQALAQKTGGAAERMEVAPERFNVLATWGTPRVTLSTHMDTVPPFFPSREDEEFVWGRGACDAKGIIAAMIAAAGKLLADGTRNFALLFVVGEEKDSLGAHTAAKTGRGSKFLINGEPTENKLAIGSKGALRYELVGRGKLAHSAYPELGDSAIHKLLDAIETIRKISLPEDPLLGKATLNVGTVSGGRAPNVVADSARAELMFRVVSDPGPLRKAMAAAVAGRVEAREELYTPAVRMEAVDGLPTTVVAFTTDIPNFRGAWGKPLLLGPGSIHVAHTAEERIAKKELRDAVEMYAALAKRLIES